MNNEQLFKHFQPLILKFANTEVGKYYLNIPQDTGEIVKLTPNSYHAMRYDAIEATFFTFDLFFNKLGSALEKLSLIRYKYVAGIDDALKALTQYAGLKHYNFPGVHLTIKTVNTSSGSGVIESVGKATWSLARDAASGVITTSSPIASCYSTYRNPIFDNSRSFFGFVTSSIPDSVSSAPFLSAVMKIYITARAGTDTETLNVVSMSSGDPTSLVTTDYVNVGSTSVSSLAYGSASTSAYNSLTLDSTGRGYISRTGTTKLALRTSRDITNTAPSVDQPSGNSLTIHNSGGANPPQLVITYRDPGAFMMNFI